MISDGLLNFPFRLAATLCCCTTGGIQLLVALTFRPRQVRRIVEYSFSMRRVLVQSAFAMATLLAAALGVPTVEASAIDRRLKRIVSGEPPYSEVNQIISEAIRSNVAATPSVLDEIATRLLVFLQEEPSESQRQIISETLFNLNLYRLFSWNGLRLTVLCLSKPRFYFPKGVYTLKTEPSPFKRIYIFGEGRDTTTIRSDFFKPDTLFRLDVQHGDVLFSELSFDNAGVSMDLAAIITGSRTGAFIDCNVTGFHQDVGQIAWYNVTFTRCAISYSGGALHFFNVRFINCTFNFGVGQPQRILQRIQEMGNEAIYLDES